MTDATKNEIVELIKKWREASREIAGFTIFAGFFGVLYLLVTREAPAGNKDTLLVLLGVLAGSFKDVVGFLWGGSMGSEKKTEAIVAQSKE